MAEYSGTGYGKLKIGAIDLAAHSSSSSRAGQGRSRVRGPHGDRQRPPDLERRDLRRAPRGPQGGRRARVSPRSRSTDWRLGIQSVVSAAQLIKLGEANTVLAGGMENMSQAPFVLHGARDGYRFGVQPQLEDLLFASLYDPYGDTYMAQTAEKIGRRLGITREEQDEFALRSHRLGAEAVQSGRFAEEIAPIVIPNKRGDITIDTDDHIKPDTTIEGLAKLRAAFGKEGTVTAGNASGIGRRRGLRRLHHRRAPAPTLDVMGVDAATATSASIRPRWASARSRRSRSCWPTRHVDGRHRLLRDQRGLLSSVPGL